MTRPSHVIFALAFAVAGCKHVRMTPPQSVRHASKEAALSAAWRECADTTDKTVFNSHGYSLGNEFAPESFAVARMDFPWPIPPGTVTVYRKPYGRLIEHIAGLTYGEHVEIFGFATAAAPAMSERVHRSQIVGIVIRKHLFSHEKTSAEAESSADFFHPQPTTTMPTQKKPTKKPAATATTPSYHIDLHPNLYVVTVDDVSVEWPIERGDEATNRIAALRAQGYTVTVSVRDSAGKIVARA